jgi:hypothetical protein
MKTILELNRPVKTRQPCDMTVAELRTDNRRLKKELKMAREGLKGMLKTMRQMERETLWMMEHCEFRTCTPTRAEALAHD